MSGVSFTLRKAALGESCSICLDTYPVDFMVLSHDDILHPYHPECLTKWINSPINAQKEACCPNCNAKIGAINGESIENLAAKVKRAALLQWRIDAQAARKELDEGMAAARELQTALLQAKQSAPVEPQKPAAQNAKQESKACSIQ